MSVGRSETELEYGLIREVVGKLFVAVDELFEESHVKMRFIPKNYAHVNGVAALGHLCHLTEALIDVAEGTNDSLRTALIIRNFIETWAVGLCLTLGNEKDVSRYFGMIAKLEEGDLAEFDALQTAGHLPPTFERPGRNFDPEMFRGLGYPVVTPKLWSFKSIFDRAAELLRACGLAEVGETLYRFVYRKLSNQLGGHPSPHVFDRYFDGDRVLVCYSRAPAVGGPRFDETTECIKNCWVAIQFTVIYALAIAVTKGAPRTELDDLMKKAQTLGKRWAADGSSVSGSARMNGSDVVLVVN